LVRIPSWFVSGEEAFFMRTRWFPFVLLLACAPVVCAQQGKVIFSTVPINLASPGASTPAFKAGDPIYAAIILPASIKSLCGTSVSRNATKEALDLKHFIDNNYRDSGGMIAKGKYFSEATAIPLDVAPAPAQMTAYKDPDLEYKQFGDIHYGAIHWSRELGTLSGGSHTFRIEIEACSSPVAQGEFKIAGAAYSHYAQLVGAMKAEQTKTVGMSAPKRNDSALEATMLKAMKASSSAAWKDEIIRVVILDPDWFIERHPVSGIILFRYIRAQVAVRGSAGCSFYNLTTFKQDHVGGQFKPVYYDGHGDQTQIPCENVKR
jgi:hypothetical protein